MRLGLMVKYAQPVQSVHVGKNNTMQYVFSIIKTLLTIREE